MGTGHAPAVATPASPFVVNATAARQHARPVSPFPHLLCTTALAVLPGVGLRCLVVGVRRVSASQ
jgi:hypothetical protein